MKKKGKLIITPNPSLSSSDRYGKWRRADMSEVGNGKSSRQQPSQGEGSSMPEFLQRNGA